jgi:hypothetical protein
MSQTPLMPKATAVWLIDNTALTFEQIADFCKLHPLEVKGIADGEVAGGIKGMDPVISGQLSRDEIAKAEANSQYMMKLHVNNVGLPEVTRHKGPRYTPLSRRQDRPNAILWLLRSHPELKDAQIMRLVGTTKTTIAQIKERTHWNINTLAPLDPVTLGLCSQIDLDFEVARASKDRSATMHAGGQTLLPAETTTAPEPAPAASSNPFGEFTQTPVKQEEEPHYDADSVFSKLKTLKTDH